MRYEKIDSSLFKENRDNFISHLPPNSIAVFVSNDVFVTGADSTLPFVQSPDLFYLTGIDQENTSLILLKTENETKSILFVLPTSKEMIIWEGKKLSLEEAKKISEVDEVVYSNKFYHYLNQLSSKVKTIYLLQNEHSRKGNTGFESAQDRLVKELKENYPFHKLERAYPILEKLRVVKSKVEIDLIKKASNITKKGFIQVLKNIQDGIGEYELEAEMGATFIKNKSKGFAYTPIFASGENACVLHYIQNSKICQNGELILIDAAAEYANYKSDLTRTIPVSGKYSKRQKAVYEAVLRVKKEAEKLLVEGAVLSHYHKQIGELMTKELIDLQLLDIGEVKNQDENNPLYKKYFMHGTSHFLGLDTHDYGNYELPLKEGMVMTIEPGIYIREENLGIRIEDTYVVQKNEKAKNLMPTIPIETEEIEEIIQTKQY